MALCRPETFLFWGTLALLLAATGAARTRTGPPLALPVCRLRFPSAEEEDAEEEDAEEEDAEEEDAEEEDAEEEAPLLAPFCGGNLSPSW